MKTATRSRQVEPAEVREAWLKYTEETRGQPAARYAEVEPWAWAQLQARLAALHKKEAA